VGLFGHRENDAPLATPLPPAHPALASVDALLDASLHDLAVAVLVAGVAPGPAEMERLTSSDVYLRIKDAVCAAEPGPDAGSQFDHRSGNVVDEGVQVLEKSLLVRTLHMGSSLVIYVNRRGQEAIASDDPGGFVVAPGA
jgi:hypothetical protein